MTIKKAHVVHYEKYDEKIWSYTCLTNSLLVMQLRLLRSQILFKRRLQRWTKVWNAPVTKIQDEG